MQDTVARAVNDERVSDRLWLPGLVGAMTLDVIGVVAFFTGPLWLAITTWAASAVVIVASIRRG
jgi:hypothetical protein